MYSMRNLEKSLLLLLIISTSVFIIFYFVQLEYRRVKFQKY